MKINEELKKYLDEKILVKYDNNIGGHGIDHIKYVIERSFEIIDEFSLNVDNNIVYTVAMYHDIGYKIDPEEHNVVSAQIFIKDKAMNNFFSDDERKIIYEAIVDHRASLEYDARSIYGKIVSSADREINVDRLLSRSLLFAFDKFKNKKIDEKEIIEDSYNKISKKYGSDGYAKIYYKERKYLDFIKKIRYLTENKEEFIKYELELLKTLT